jgi:hypothetical protein
VVYELKDAKECVYLSAQINIVIVIIINAAATVAVVAFHSVAY